MALENDLARILVAGLQRKAISKCSDWAVKYRLMPNGPYNFIEYPWIREIIDARCSKRVVIKGAQLGYTEAALTRTLYKMDVDRVDCLYLLPRQNPDATNFSAGRFDSAIDLSPYLKTLFSNVKNVGLKRAGPTSLYVRGMQAKEGLRGLPVGVVIIDEYDVCPPDNIRLAKTRLDGQEVKELWEFSTPTIPDYGIHEEYKTSTQEHFFFRCPNCNQFAELVFPDSLVITADSITDPDIYKSHYRLIPCGHLITQVQKRLSMQKGMWQITAPQYDLDIRGWNLSQYYSYRKGPVEIAREAIAARTNPIENAEFHNSVGGVPFTHDGAKLGNADINACRSDYNMYPHHLRPRGFTTMGVDVGGVLNVEICEWEVVPGADINTHSTPKVLLATTVKDFSDLDAFMRDFQVQFCVIDAMPETRASKTFADKFPNSVKLCYYSGGRSRPINVADSLFVTVDRTYWIDIVFDRFRRRNILLPKNLPDSYVPQVTAMTRIDKRNPETGDVTARYVHTMADHYTHSRVYNEVALLVGVAQHHNADISSFL